MFSLKTSSQLAAYLRSLRKSQGLTQSALGAKLGVSAARISAIERNPSGLAFGQLLKLLHVLGARLQLEIAPTARTWMVFREMPTGEW
jgi:HTH-type transcriptional regulator / antitoxin HipB